MLRRLQEAAPATVADFFQTAAREIRCTLIDLARRHFGPLGAGVHEKGLPAAGESTASGKPIRGPRFRR